ncbi:hypothetical protein HMPREF1982_01879 [Clostridiales bacterium oral taxon 876 str. F0540]|nr:hypothetical protein HMPREF1982_01879 [Clostridiales bacterium oral taxon 876 str. F0540]
MNESLKEVIFKFFFILAFFLIVGYFVKSFNMNFNKAFFMSLGMSTVDLVIFIYKKSKKANE